MSATPTPPAPAAAWYTSKVQITQIATTLFALVGAFPIIGKWLHLNSMTDALAAVSAVAALAAIVSPLVGTFIRARSPLQPLTLTKAGAEVHPQTQAAVFTAGLQPDQASAVQHPVAGYIPVTQPILKIDPTKPWGTSK